MKKKIICIGILSMFLVNILSMASGLNISTNNIEEEYDIIGHVELRINGFSVDVNVNIEKAPEKWSKSKILKVKLNYELDAYLDELPEEVQGVILYGFGSGLAISDKNGNYHFIFKHHTDADLDTSYWFNTETDEWDISDFEGDELTIEVASTVEVEYYGQMPSIEVYESDENTQLLPIAKVRNYRLRILELFPLLQRILKL
jgi:hypothetical protein